MTPKDWSQKTGSVMHSRCREEKQTEKKNPTQTPKKLNKKTVHKNQGWKTTLAASALNFRSLLIRAAKLTLKCQDSHLNTSLEMRKTIAPSGFEMTLEGT